MKKLLTSVVLAMFLAAVPVFGETRTGAESLPVETDNSIAQAGEQLNYGNGWLQPRRRRRVRRMVRRHRRRHIRRVHYRQTYRIRQRRGRSIIIRR